MLKSMIKNPAEKVTFVSVVIDFVLSLIKISGGVLFQSSGLVADGIHSLSDLLSDAMVIVILRISGKKADKEHPWGHGRFETAGTALLGGSLMILGGLIAYDNALKLLNYQTIPTPSWPALIAIISSIILKEWLYHYTLKVGKRLKSDLLIANAWHHRTDSLSSIAVLIGLIGALFGYVWLDALMAIVVAILIFKIGFSFAKSAFRQLVDTALEPNEVQQLTEIALGVAGVKSVHDFKTRGTGSKIILEMHIQVNPFISSSEGHQIGEKVVSRLEKKAKEIDIAHVIYHIDTFNDQIEKHSDYHYLPLRDEIEPVVRESLFEIDENLKYQRINLHYHKKKVGIEIGFKQNDWNKPKDEIKEIIEKIEKDLLEKINKAEKRQLNWLHSVEIFWLYSK